tara:strand:+ start:925 stop:1383 length:459 start_codon:yes stop_codon:yes gene_type:complete
MDIKKKLSPRENENTVDAVIARLEPILVSGNKVTSNFTNRMFALEKKLKLTNTNQINLQLESQRHNTENLNKFLINFSFAFNNLENKIMEIDQKSQATFELLEDIKEVKEIVPLIKEMHHWIFSIANLLNAELNYPSPKSGEYLEDLEEDDD